MIKMHSLCVRLATTLARRCRSTVPSTATAKKEEVDVNEPKIWEDPWFHVRKETGQTETQPQYTKVRRDFFVFLSLHVLHRQYWRRALTGRMWSVCSRRHMCPSHPSTPSIRRPVAGNRQEVRKQLHRFYISFLQIHHPTCRIE